MDALSDVLRVSQLTGGVFLHADFFAPWCVESHMEPSHCSPYLGPAAHLIIYHYILEGELSLVVKEDDDQTFVIREGEVVLLPRNDAHLMGSDLSLVPALGSELVQRPIEGGLFNIRHGGNGDTTKMVCGFLGCQSADGNPVLSTLPPVLTLNAGQSEAGDWIRSTFRFAAEEVAAGRPGSETILSKLSELLFVEAVRNYADNLAKDQTGWLAGLQDPYVARVLALFHSQVNRPWTVEDLSREVGLSRSALADRFTRLIGEAPMHYLANWRMQLAAERLKNTRDSLAQIAGAVGYDSEAAFSRAFKKAFGTAPGTWRRSHT